MRSRGRGSVRCAGVTIERDTLRIALVIRRYDHAGGGAERWTHDHAVRLLEAGHRVHLVSSRFTGAPLGAMQHEVVAGPRWYRNAARAFAQSAAAVVAGLGVDVVHDMGHTAAGDVFMPHHGTWAANFAMRGRLRGAPVRWLRRLAASALPRYRAQAALERAQLRSGRLRAAVAVSRMIGAELRAAGVPARCVRVIHNGADLERFTPVAGARERLEAKERLGARGRSVIVTVAQDFWRKGVDRAIGALARLTDLEPRPLLLVIGRDPPGWFVRRARRLGCEGLVRFEGPREDVVDYYHAADVSLLPTRYDPCALVTLESLACGVPVVTTAANGSSELFTHGVEGLIVPDASDERALAEALAAALEPRTRARLSAGALRLRPSLDVRRCFERHVALYRELAGAVPAASAVEVG